MKIYEATEIAYKNGYEAGKRDALAKNPVTNADRIRAMTDEELAELLCNRVDDCYAGHCPGAPLCRRGDGKANGLRKWLKQPAEGEAPNGQE